MQLEKEQAVSRERNRIAQGIHDDIGSTVSSISIMSDLVLKSVNGDKQSAMISNIRETSISLMEKIDDLVWSIHPGNDSLFNLLVRIREIAIVLFEAKGIDYEIELPETIDSFYISIEHRQHIYLILKEAINNIVRHSKATKARIEISLLNENLSILISDNGKGFNKAQVSDRNGIKNMNNRAAEINGTIKIDSDADCGTIILLTVKIK